MVKTSRTFRIFVSPTFSDLKEERNAIQKHVFPRLRELFMQNGCCFQAIDLRCVVSGRRLSWDPADHEDLLRGDFRGVRKGLHARTSSCSWTGDMTGNRGPLRFLIRSSRKLSALSRMVIQNCSRIGTSAIIMPYH